VLAVGQSAMVRKEWIEQKQFLKITEATRQAIELAKSIHTTG